MQEDELLFPLIVLEDADQQETLQNWSPRGSSEASPWERCLAQFLRQLYDRSRSTKSVQDYRRTLITFFSSSAHGGPPKHPELYTREDVEDFLHRPSTSSRNVGALPATATRNQRLAIISSFYKFAATFTVAAGPEQRPEPLLRTSAPTLGLRHARPDRVYRALSEEELDAFFAIIPTDTVQGLRDRAIFLLYFWTARRREEIARLRWGDLEQGVIVEEGGRRRQGWRYRFRGKGKSGQEDIAELPLPAKLAIDRYLAAARRSKTLQADDPLFIALGPEQGGGKRGVTLPRDSKSPLTSSTISKLLKKYARAAGIDAERLSIHSWRHTAAMQRYAAGEDVRSLQRLLRHSNIATTDTYVRGIMGSADPGARLLEDRFAHLSGPAETQK